MSSNIPPNKHVIHINYGLACRIRNKIFINRELKKNKKLYKALIKHEQQHTDKFKVKDVLIDLGENEFKGLKKDYYGFLLRNPKSWIHFLPIWKYGKTWAIDPIMTLIWILIFIIFKII